jgi:hypothetical protein
MTYAYHIAQAMAFLESKSIVHGHLAALVIILCHVYYFASNLVAHRRCVIVYKRGSMCKVGEVGRLQAELESGMG